MKRIAIAVLVAGGITAAAGQASAVSLSLTCTGSATGSKTGTGTLQIEINGREGRMHPPTFFRPSVMDMKGVGGWYPVKNVNDSDDEISGEYEVNAISSRTFVIDRTTGMLSIQDGRALFTAKCAIPEKKGPRLF